MSKANKAAINAKNIHPDDFLKPTLEEYKAMVKLRRAGFERVFIQIEGSGDDGTYFPIQYEPYDKNASAFRKELQLLEKYLERNLDARSDFSFNGDGCRGEISISLQENEFAMTFATEVAVWMDGVYVEGKVTPNTCLEQLAAELADE